MDTNVVLIGMMGSGKTTIGRLLAEKTGMEFIDLDELVERRAGMTIAEIFQGHGEEHFRDLESQVLEEIASSRHAVIATGGGIVKRAENRQLLRDLGLVVWLDAPAEVLAERIGEDPDRPLLSRSQPLKKLTQLLHERRDLYAETSHIHLDTTEHTPEEIAARILEELHERYKDEEEDVFATIVAIDGPVASGKSSLAKKVAKRLGFMHIDTGAMYRCVAFEAMRRGIPLDDQDALAELAHSLDIRYVEQPDDMPGRVLLNGEDVTEAIRAPEVSRNTSPVADIPNVRAELVRLQRQMALRGRCVLDGRDIGTVVVPEAHWKFYVVASLEERIRRRLVQHQQEGHAVDVERLRMDIIERDRRDRIRTHGALRLAPTATILDTTGISLEEAVEIVAALVGGSVGAPS
ncbi:MAG: (d)CMP kinase [Candidatus Sumerlaeaceae bacterium]|nr:(d)CMP kinase [Candidatus Sumerlaeaceae bacterium]